MKTLEQLGISPAPWYIEENTGVLCAKSEYYKHPIVDDYGNFENNNDKRLIAAAPELYEALLDLLFGYNGCCGLCEGHGFSDCSACNRSKARAALEKAGGIGECKKGEMK